MPSICMKYTICWGLQTIGALFYRTPLSSPLHTPLLSSLVLLLPAFFLSLGLLNDIGRVQYELCLHLGVQITFLRWM